MPTPSLIHRIVIVGTGLIGGSAGLAMRQAGFRGTVTGMDLDEAELQTSLRLGAVTGVASSPEDRRRAISEADLVLLAVPVLAILQWIETLAPLLKPGALVTDAGSTKLQIAEAAGRLLPGRFLPGHPMAGKESGGASLAEASLFRGAAWIFTPLHETTPIEAEFRGLVDGIGAHSLNLEAARHDELCAWVSHLPQMVSTAMSALLEDTFGDAPELRAIGGRALREMTRLGASPFSMWRDIAHTNAQPIAATLLALEQRLQHLRENLRTPGLRDEFALANRFRSGR